MPFSATVNTNILLHFFTGTALGSPPASYDVILYTTTPGLNGTGGVEAAYSNYSRVNYANSDPNWDVETVTSPSLLYQAKNASIITLPTPSANGTDITGAGLLFVGTNNLLTWGSFSTPRPVISGVEISIPVGFFKAQFTPAS